jgi:hypothetical protein
VPPSVEESDFIEIAAPHEQAHRHARAA